MSDTGLVLMDFMVDDTIPRDVKMRLMFKLCVKSTEGRAVMISSIHSAYDEQYAGRLPSDRQLDLLFQIPGIDVHDIDIEELLEIGRW